MPNNEIPVFNGKLLKVYDTEEVLPNGVKARIESVRHPGAAIIVITAGEKIVFLRQYRPVVDEYLWELPAGKIDRGEDPAECIAREAIEETGYRVDSPSYLGFIYTTPGFCDEKIHVFSGKASENTGADPEDDEIIKVELLGRGEIIELFKNGDIVDSKTLSALAMSGFFGCQ